MSKICQPLIEFALLDRAPGSPFPGPKIKLHDPPVGLETQIWPELLELASQLLAAFQR